MRPLCFVLMPFKVKSDAGLTVDFDEVYRRIIRPAVERADMTCVRSDEEQIGGIIHRSMFERLMLCEYAVADLTMANANVYYELGIRHAMRPWSTVLVSASGFRLPFDVAPQAVVRYQLDSAGVPDEAEYQANRAALSGRLREARRRKGTDSPLFDLFRRLEPPKVHVGDAATFAERIREAGTLQRRLAIARGPAEIAAVRTDIGDLDGHDDGVLIDLLLAYRRFMRWPEMIALIQELPTHIRDTATVREQEAFAFNRIEAGSPEAERVLQELCAEWGPSAETLGLLGRVYKDRWLAAGDSPVSDGYLAQAIDTYRRGFETDWRDPYPGINAVHLLWLAGDRDAEITELLPVVEYSVTRRIEGGSGSYWDFATMIEVAIYRDRAPTTIHWLAKALATRPGPMEADSTLQTILRIRDKIKASGEPWDTLVTELRRATRPPGTAP